MRKCSICFLVSIICFFIFVVGKVNAQDISCEYSMKESDGAKCYYNHDIRSDSTFSVVIYNDTQIDELNRDFPKFVIDGKNGSYTNNVTALETETVLHPPLKIGDSHVSAKKYYNEIGACPPYFSISLTTDEYIGTFASIEKEPTDYLACTFPLKPLQYDENFEKTDEIYSCTLYSTDIMLKDIKVNLQINYTNKTISFGGITTDERKGSSEALENYKKTFDFNTKNNCPTGELKVCEVLNSVFIYPKDFSNHPAGTCAILDSTEELKVGDTYCKYILDITKDMKETKEGYYNKLSKIKKLCNPILKFTNYDSVKYSCMDVCLNIKDYLPGIEFNSGTCGFTERLIVWIANIIRWVKYIIPVAVIVLGILDFIKAISADKEDEMNKAQQRFIRRLIAAALIFIAPFIIEFILNKLGFAANGCGIINL